VWINLNDLNLQILDARKDLEKIFHVWGSLYRGASDGFFLSWAWVGAWLETLPSGREVKLICGQSGDEYQFAMLLGINRRKQDFYFRSAHLCSLGDSYFDDIVIENNGVLCVRNFEFSHELIDKIVSLLDVHVVVFPHLKPSYMEPVSRFRKSGDYSIRYCEAKSYFVDLVKISQDYSSFISSLSANKRHQIRRSISLYEQRGELTISKASTLTEANNFYDILVELHQRAWKDRGKPGSFTSKYFDDFHRHMLQHSFNPERIRLYVFYVGEQPVGALYGFVEGRTFSFYQSGFLYEKDNRIKPGLVCHALLIQELASEGLDYYDFLAGSATYKKSLGTGHYIMPTIELTRNHWFSGMLHWLGSKFRTPPPRS
jgi:CelD/BcsL family acetyltransferase involved in cellulose biosynthesis